MKRLLFQGNHSSCHCGSEAVWNRISSACKENNFKKAGDMDSADIVIINGEGSMHHNRKGFQQKLDTINNAINKGKEVHLINTVWQENTCEIPAMLRMPHRIVVRECLSAMDLLKNHGVCPTVVPDIACFAITPEQSLEIGKIRDKKRSSSALRTTGLSSLRTLGRFLSMNTKSFWIVCALRSNCWQRAKLIASS